MTVLCALLGTILVLVLLDEVFESLVLPRRVTRSFRISNVYYRFAWHAWKTLAALVPKGPRRETFLSVFGPLSLLTLFAIWATGLVFAFALLQIAATAPENERRSFLDNLYFSGATFTTLGYGDIVPIGPAGRVLAVVESMIGFGFFAVVIGYLPVLYQAVSNREALISLLDARASSPPAAGRLLVRLGPGKKDGVVLGRFLEDAERWAAELLESQLSFPVLGYYRSQHDNQSWLAALTCILDTSALLLTLVDGMDRRQVRLTFAMARHALVDLALVLKRRPHFERPERLPQERLCALIEALRAEGVVVRKDEQACAKLTELRELYEPFAVSLAVHLRLTVPDMWPESDRPDNWQTSAWMRRASPLTALGIDPRDDHFA
jgi:voltage-gated potassium channel Kch